MALRVKKVAKKGLKSVFLSDYVVFVRAQPTRWTKVLCYRTFFDGRRMWIPCEEFYIAIILSMRSDRSLKYASSPPRSSVVMNPL